MTNPLEPNDLSHLSDEEFMALCPQGFHATGDFEPNNWRNKIMALVKKHDLGFLHNPGGGQFTNADKGINIQVPFYDYQEDYVVLLNGLLELGVESFKSLTDHSSSVQ